MCLIQAPNPKSFILVKVVEAPEAWEIAKTANFQNKVEQIQLLLAEYIRFPLVQGIGMKRDVHIHSPYTSVLDVFTTFYRHEVAYEEIDYLFLGFFSRNIRLIIDANYTEIRDVLLKTIQGPEESEVMSSLLSLNSMMYREKQQSSWQNYSLRTMIRARMSRMEISFNDFGMTINLITARSLPF